MGFRMAHLHLILAHCKSQGQGHVNLNSGYFENDDV